MNSQLIRKQFKTTKLITINNHTTTHDKVLVSFPPRSMYGTILTISFLPARIILVRKDKLGI
jgi:hypothetical protein